MKCPHCAVHFHENWEDNGLYRDQQFIGWNYSTARCPNCGKLIIKVVGRTKREIMVYPRGATRGPIPPAVPPEIATDYVEACDVLPISAKASAALARRCLQNMLRAHGYQDRDLAKEIDQLLGETNPRKAIPETLRATIDGIRNFGNFSAHPITDQTTLQIIDVEEHEAEWCLEILEEAFDHFYVRPAAAVARKAALDAKLAAAGKPQSK